jgi:hypothetical protein
MFANWNLIHALLVFAALDIIALMGIEVAQWFKKG